MNKSAAKEPSMDEILSSIRQIIADDDAGDAPPPAQAVEDIEEEVDFALPEVGEDDEEAMPLELSSEQIVETEDDSIDFEGLSAALDEDAAAEANDEEFSVPDLVVPDDIAFDENASEEQPVAEAEPLIEDPAPQQSNAPEMPDPNLSGDIAEQLLEPATSAAVKNTFSKLGTLALGANNLTIENMIREMLRPMLKEWLDENLPSVVESMVEREIERLSRGG